MRITKESVNALMWYTGCTKAAAYKELKTMDHARVLLIIKAFKDNAKRALYND